MLSNDEQAAIDAFCAAHPGEYDNIRSATELVNWLRNRTATSENLEAAHRELQLQKMPLEDLRFMMQQGYTLDEALGTDSEKPAKPPEQMSNEELRTAMMEEVHSNKPWDGNAI